MTRKYFFLLSFWQKTRSWFFSFYLTHKIGFILLAWIFFLSIFLEHHEIQTGFFKRNFKQWYTNLSMCQRNLETHTYMHSYTYVHIKNKKKETGTHDTRYDRKEERIYKHQNKSSDPFLFSCACTVRELATRRKNAEISPGLISEAHSSHSW